MRKLPLWVMNQNKPSVYDSESATAIEMVGKVYGAMQELIDEYNSFATNVNNIIDEFTSATVKDYETFKVAIRQEFQDFIDVVDLKILSQDKKIEELATYIKSNINGAIKELLKELQDSGELDTAILTALGNIQTQLNDFKTETETNFNDFKTETETNFNDVNDSVNNVDKRIEEHEKNYLDYVITPQMFGAVGDGVTDDTNAFRDALNSTAILFIPKGRYKITEVLTIPSTISCIRGDYVADTYILLDNGGFTCEKNSSLCLENIKIVGTGIETGFNGNIVFSKFNNVSFQQLKIGINFNEETWINSFVNCRFFDCETGINTVNSFNNNNFYNCYFQRNNIAFVGTHGYQILFNGCNFEMNEKAFQLAHLKDFVVTDSYIEGNELIINFVKPCFEGNYTFDRCYFYSPNVNGWFAKIPFYSSQDVKSSTLNITNSYFKMVSNESVKAFDFYGDDGKLSVITVNVKNNYFYNLNVDTYFDLFNLETSAYGTYGNPHPIQTDLPLYKIDNCVWGLKLLGQPYSLYWKTMLYECKGVYNVESTGISEISIPLPKTLTRLVNKTAIGLVPVFYTDGSVENCNLYYDTDNFFIKVNSEKTTQKIIFNVVY